MTPYRILISALLVLMPLHAFAPQALAQAPSPFGSLIPTESQETAVRLQVLKVDDISATDSVYTVERKPIETGWMATVQGTISDRQYLVFVLVHPLLGDSWVVQSPVARPSISGIWRTTCLFGSARKGKDEDYELMAVGSQQRDLYRPGQRIMASHFPPPDIPQTDSVLIRRVRSPNP